jgi:2Fe-2S ferredoxin
MIYFRKDRKPIPAAKYENLMQALLKAGLPVASSCYGKGVCSKCRVQVVSGMENLSPESKLETELKQKNNIANDCRISCQTAVLGDVTIDTPYW